MKISIQGDIQSWDLGKALAGAHDFEQANFFNCWATELGSRATPEQLRPHLAKIGERLDVNTKLRLAIMIGTSL